MKKLITLICISLFVTLSISAQHKSGGKEKIRALKIAYLTEQLQLTADEAQKFWPIYNAYDKEQNSLRDAYRSVLRKTIKKNEAIDNFSEEESKKLIGLKLSSDEKAFKSKKAFIKKIESVISYKKIIKLQVAEMEFGRKLMRKYKRKKSNSKN